jgi:hypothetical protein
VEVKAPGYDLWMSFSSSLGVSSEKMEDSSVSGVKMGAPEGVSWTMWIMGEDAER